MLVNVSSLPPDSEGQPSRSAPRIGGVHVVARPRRHISSSLMALSARGHEDALR